MGGPVVTDHIQHLLESALDLARDANGRTWAEVKRTLPQLERAANLAAHAAQEIHDERLRLRDGWPA